MADAAHYDPLSEKLSMKHRARMPALAAAFALALAPAAMLLRRCQWPSPPFYALLHGRRLGRIIDPFGHEGEIGAPIGPWPPG